MVESQINLYLERIYHQIQYALKGTDVGIGGLNSLSNSSPKVKGARI